MVALWQRNWMAPPPEARWDWLYESGSGRGFLLHDPIDGCVGVCGFMPRTMRVQGADIQAGVAADLGVDQAHRSVGPALKLERALARAADDADIRFIYAFPNLRSEPVFARIGYRKLGPFERWSLPLRSERYLRRVLPGSRLAQAASCVVDAGLKLTFGQRRAPTPPGARIEEITRYDERFDDLWQRVAARRRVLGERSAAYLTWRFASDPDGGFRTLAVAGPGGELDAYVIFRRRGEVVSVVDCLYDSLAGWQCAVATFLQRMRAERAASVSFWFLGPREPLEVLHRFGFWLRGSPRSVFLRVAPGTAPAPASCDRNDWWLTVADADGNR